MNRDSTRGNKKLDRRTLVKNSAAFIGVGIVGLIVKSAKASESILQADKNSNYFNVKTFGASGNRNDKATKPVQEAIDSCTRAGGGVVYVPPGDYTVGSIELKDNVTLHLEAGATFFLSQDSDDFVSGARAMVFANGANNFAVTGRGTLDGLAQYEFSEMRGVDVEIVKEIEIARVAGIDMRRYYRTGMQTFMFVLNDCKNILLQDISIINSPLWTVRLNSCDRVNINGVYIYSDLEKGVNADGIDICSTSNVMISNSVIVTADDAIVLKTPKQRGQEGPVKPVENIVVTNCILSSSSTPLQIGTETFADISHVLFDNCTIRNSNKGFGINVQDGCTVQDIIYNNLTIETSRRHWNWWGDSEMCKFVLKKREANSKLGKIKDVVISNIIAHPRGKSTIKGHPDQPIENFRLSNVQIQMLPEDAKDKRATHAFEIENVNGVVIRDLTVCWDEDNAEEKWQSALVVKNVSGLEVNSFSGRQGRKNNSSPAIILEDVADVVIRDSKATHGCDTFVHIQGTRSEGITFRFNDVKKAKQGISYENDNIKKVVEMYPPEHLHKL